MTLKLGDVIRADKHGAVVIPINANHAIAKVAELITRREAVVFNAARAPDATLAKIKQALVASAEIN